MSIANRNLPPDLAATHRRLRALEQEWRQRKSEQVYREVSEAAGKLTRRFTGYDHIRVEAGERAVIVRIGEDRELRLSLVLSFDDGGHMSKAFVVRDRQIRRRPEYDEVEALHRFDKLDQAVAYVIRASC